MSHLGFWGPIKFLAVTEMHLIMFINQPVIS